MDSLDKFVELRYEILRRSARMFKGIPYKERKNPLIIDDIIESLRQDKRLKIDSLTEKSVEEIKRDLASVANQQEKKVEVLIKRESKKREQLQSVIVGKDVNQQQISREISGLSAKIEKLERDYCPQISATKYPLITTEVENFDSTKDQGLFNPFVEGDGVLVSCVKVGETYIVEKTK